MVGYLGMPGVGAVGARLLFPDGRIQHAGVIHGLYHGKAGPAFKLSPCWDNGYLSYARVARNYSAVTAACMLTRRDHFLSLGGFDEEAFAVAYNDVDYGYRMIDAGHRIVYCPGAELLHHEGHSRGSLDNPEELASFLGKYRGRRDPYYNVNLSLDDERFSIEARTVAPTGLGPIPTLMLAFNLNWEGTPYSQFEMTARLKEMGIIEPVVYCPHDGPLRKEYERIGVRVDLFPHPVSGVFTIAAYEEAIRAFSRYIRENGVELVYGNTLQTFYGIDAAREAGLPSIWNPRESEPWQTYFDHFVPEIAARALACFRYPYKVVFVADATRERFSALNTHHNFTTVHNGLNRDRFEATLARWPREAARRHLDLGEDSLAVLILGTVCDRKGQLDVIEALGHLDEGSAPPGHWHHRRGPPRSLQRTAARGPPEPRGADEFADPDHPRDVGRRPLLLGRRPVRLLVPDRELPSGYPRGHGRRPADHHDPGLRNPGAGAREHQRPVLSARG